jgi:hypothetical protein
MRAVHVQSIPRTVLLDTKTGSNLLQWPVVEVENLRMSGKSFDGVALDRGSVVPLDVGKATQVTPHAACCSERTLDLVNSLADRPCACSWTSRLCSRWTRRTRRP